MKAEALRNGVARAVAVLRRVASEFGAAEVGLILGVVLITAALWPPLGRLALLVPGLVLLWIALPSRSWFVVPPPTPPQKVHRERTSS